MIITVTRKKERKMIPQNTNTNTNTTTNTKLLLLLLSVYSSSRFYIKVSPLRRTVLNDDRVYEGGNNHRGPPEHLEKLVIAVFTSSTAMLRL